MTSAISLSVLPHALSANNSFPQIPIPSNPTNYTAPIPPPGFSARLKFNSSVPLSPVEIYICAIEMLSVLANLRWNDGITMSMVMTGNDMSIECCVHPFPRGSVSKMRVRYAVLGLYAAGVAIAQGNKFYQLDGGLYMSDDEVGWFEFRPRKPSRSNSGLLVLTPGYANDTTAVVGDIAKIIDPKDHDFSVTLMWDGVRIKAQDVFTTMLDGLATAAEHDNTQSNACIHAARSASGDTVLSTWVTGEEGNPEMTWARLKRALIMMWDLVIVGREGHKTRFEGLMFGMVYKGKSIGAGRMLRFDKSAEGIGGSAV